MEENWLESNANYFNPFPIDFVIKILNNYFKCIKFFTLDEKLYLFIEKSLKKDILNLELTNYYLLMFNEKLNSNKIPCSINFSYDF